MRVWVADRSKVLAPSSMRARWTIVRSLFKTAVVDRYIPFSPCDGIKGVGGEPPRIVVPTIDEILAITAELPERWRPIGLLGAQTRLRPGELLGLSVEQIDFLRKTIRVDRQTTNAGGGLRAEDRVVEAYRADRLDVTVDLLAAHLAAWPAGAGGLVFRKVDAIRPLSESGNTHVVERAVKRAGIARRVRHARHAPLLRLEPDRLGGVGAGGSGPSGP